MATSGAVAAFDYQVDPMCYYHCDRVDISKKTANFYYQAAQKVLAYPDTQLVILGSSRGQTTSPVWIEKITGLKSLNLSLGAAEMTSKIAFLNLALEKTRLRKVLWYADYFELIPEDADIKIKTTPALQTYLETEREEINPMTRVFGKMNNLLELIDHNTLEASFYTLTKNSVENHLDQGVGSGIDFEKCQKPDFKGDRTPLQLEKEAGQTYDSYSRKVLKPPQSSKAWGLFLKKIGELEQKNIQVTVVIPPYNPVFAHRLEGEFSDLYAKHRRWVQNLVNLKYSNLKVLNYFDGIPQDDSSPRFWNDGVHFTCKGVINMLSGKL